MARPQFKPTAAQRRAVAIAAGGGASHEEICQGLGIARNTLEKHFEEELSTGAYKKRMEVIQALFQAAKRGNVSAAKTYLSIEPKNATPPAPAPTKSAPLGKKEQAAIDAVGAAAGTDWSELLGPRPALQ